MIVFDECHHAKKNHDYNEVMKCYREAGDRRPKIFGMTASAVDEDIEPLHAIVYHVLI